MDYLHIKNLEKYHPHYKDRKLIWCKAYFAMLNADPEFEMLCETDKWRFLAFIMLELQIKKPVPLDESYLVRKGFNFKKRSMSLTLQMLHTLIEIRTKNVTYIREDIDIEREDVTEHPSKTKFLDFVFLSEEEHSSLINKLGEPTVKEYIERLNNYIGAKGVKYKSHYHVILTWYRKDKPILNTGTTIRRPL